jgi:hypothetical protein
MYQGVWVVCRGRRAARATPMASSITLHTLMSWCTTPTLSLPLLVLSSKLQKHSHDVWFCRATYKSLFTILYDSHRPSTSLSRHYKQSRSWTSQNRATATTTSNIVSGWLARSKTQSHGWGRRCCISWSTPGVSTVYSMEINLGLSIERNTL